MPRWHRGALRFVNESPQTPIFFDESRRRWNFLSRLSLLLSLLCAVAGCAFLVSIAFSPQLPALSLAHTLGLRPPAARHAPAETLRRQEAHYVLTKNQPLRDATRKLAAVIRRENAPQPIPAAAIAPGHVAGPVRAGFFANDDKPSLDSLNQHIGQMTHVMPVWLLISPDGSHIHDLAQFSDPNAAQDAAHADTNDDIMVRQARAHGVAILPLIQNYDSDQQYLQERLAAQPAVQPRPPGRRHRAAHGVTSRAGHYQGVNIDFETDQAGDRAGLTAFMAELAAAFHPKGLLVTQDVQLDSDTYDLPTLARVDDFLVPMLYDQHAVRRPLRPDRRAGLVQARNSRSSWRRCRATRRCWAWATTATTGRRATTTPPT